ncbi:MAG TPA: hypothetical protein VFW09_01450 [Solirubrobacteraceae bacterium]|nr:hypothetical protein [Solirubrobacteraceae bacterium]
MSPLVSISTNRRTWMIAGLGLGLALAGPAALSTAATAHGATLSVDKRCYVITRRIPSIRITGAGYQPFSHVLITSTANVDASTTADAAGRISVKVRAPAPHFSVPSVKVFRFTAKDVSVEPAIHATVRARVAPLGALHGSTPKAPGLKALTETTNWSFSGFTPGQTIYAHYTIKGRQVALKAFGTAHGDCGKLHTRAPLYPATPHHASYPVQFDSVHRFSPKTTPRITGRVSLNTSF